MRPLYEMKLIQLEITNACHVKCANCTRLVGHHRKPFFMDLDTVVKALESLEGFSGNIGLMGGEPTLHPDFAEICRIYQRIIPDKRRRQLWTSGHKWDEYRALIEETFDNDHIAYNDHSSSDGVHQPLLVAADDIIEDKEFMWDLIDNCWVQMRWSASITPKGCFFCEVAAAMDHVLDGPGGYPIEKGWWRKKPVDFADQVKRYCPGCSGAVPLKKESDNEKFDLVSQSNMNKLKTLGSPKILKGACRLYEKKHTVEELKASIKDWKPQDYRTFVAHKPEDYKERIRKSETHCSG